MTTPLEQEPNREKRQDWHPEAENSPGTSNPGSRRLSEAMIIALISALISVASLAATTYVTFKSSKQQNCNQITNDERKRIDDTANQFTQSAITYRKQVVAKMGKLKISEPTKIIVSPNGASAFDPTFANLPEYVTFYSASERVRTLLNPALALAATNVEESIVPVVFERNILNSKGEALSRIRVQVGGSEEDFRRSLDAFSSLVRYETTQSNKLVVCG